MLIVITCHLQKRLFYLGIFILVGYVNVNLYYILRISIATSTVLPEVIPRGRTDEKEKVPRPEGEA